MKTYEKYLYSLKKEFDSEQKVCQEIIHLQALLNLPKGTEHYISDLHGEYSAFKHLMNSCSGVIKEKATLLFDKEKSKEKIQEICDIVYYPKKIINKQSDRWYQETILLLIRLARYVTSKYPRTQIREYLKQYASIIDELLHAQLDEMDQQYVYHAKIIDTIIDIHAQDEFIVLLTDLIKYFAIDQLHILGDIYDRGKHPDKIMDALIKYKRVDFQWGNHDILYMGAYLGNEACIANVVKNCLKYDTLQVLERGYGIPLRIFNMYAMQRYSTLSTKEAMQCFIHDIVIKLEANVMHKYPQYMMKYRLVTKKTTLDVIEVLAMEDLKRSFMHSKRLKRHMDFLYTQGSLYLVTSHTLLYHGCMPLDKKGELLTVLCKDKMLKGKAYFDYIEQQITFAYCSNDEYAIDYLWYLWCGYHSPLCGRKVKMNGSKHEKSNTYYYFINFESTCLKILEDFNLSSASACIINGHTPVKEKLGENPIKGNGRLIVIDGGFCKNYQKQTGVAGYTLISNSHGMRIKTHKIESCLIQNEDTDYINRIIYTYPLQELIENTLKGVTIKEKIEDLKQLLQRYRTNKWG